MKGLDLSKLKKTSSDKNTTTFSHGDGHEVKIVHAMLSHPFRAQIEKLPFHDKQVRKMADGGKTSVEDLRAQDQDPAYMQAQAEKLGLTDDSPPPAQPVQAGSIAASAPQPYVQGVSNSGPTASVGSNPNNPTSDAEPTPSPMQQSQNNEVADVSAEQPQGQTLGANQGPRPDDVYQKNQAYLQNEQVKYAQDLANGHITPKDYSDLFAKHADGTDRGTLSKIGMLFGLMIGGAGSGLSHQPNALLGMMNQEIQNDLEAQKTSKSNAQNFLKIAQQQELNNAQIGLTGAQAQVARTVAGVNAQTQADALMKYTVLHNLYVKAGYLPPGPTKNAANQVLQTTTQAVDQDVANKSHQASMAVAQAHAMQPDEQTFNDTNKAFILAGEPGMAEYNEAHHIPGMAGQTSIAVPGDVRTQLNAQKILDSKGKDLLSYIGQHTGSWNPQTRSIATQKIEEMKNFYNDSIDGGALTKGRLGWYDEQFAKSPTDILPQLMGSTAKLKEMVSSNQSRMNQTKKSYGGQPEDASDQSPSGSQDQTKTAVSKSGKPLVLKNGKWVYK